eukprot:15303034-Ditylum_brightwellii.AAC.1
MSAIKAEKLSMDLSNDVIKPGVFECSLFDLKIKQAMQFMPYINGMNQGTGKVLYHEKHVSETMIDACMDQTFNSR